MSELFVCWPSTRPVAECDRHPHGTRRCIKSVEHWIHTTDSGRHGLPGGQYLDNPGHRCAVFRGYAVNWQKCLWKRLLWLQPLALVWPPPEALRLFTPQPLGHRWAVTQGYSDIALPGKRCHCSIVLIHLQVSDNSRPWPCCGLRPPTSTTALVQKNLLAKLE